VICVYLFDPIFNEANESSSACEPGIELHVETNTPPNQRKISARFTLIQGGARPYSQTASPQISSFLIAKRPPGLRKKLDHKRKLIRFAVALLHRADDGEKQPGDSDDHVERNQE
jgi:hypothetical protein